jgi:hypothetical protein
VKEVSKREGKRSWPAWPFSLNHQVWIFDQATYMCSQIVSEHQHDEPSDAPHWRIFKDEKFRKEGIDMEEGFVEKKMILEDHMRA